MGPMPDRPRIRSATGPAGAPLRIPGMDPSTQTAPSPACSTGRTDARAVAGVLPSGVLLAVGHALAGLIDTVSPPYLAVAASVVDRSPAAVREATIDALGTADKPALLLGLAV